MNPINILSKWPTGSRYICNPPPTDTDNDTVILVASFEEATKALLADGWEEGGSLTPAELGLVLDDGMPF